MLRMAEPITLELPVVELRLTEDNPRRITEKQFGRLCRSLQEDPSLTFGRPVLVNKRESGEYYVVGGNMRVRAALHLGWETIRCCVYEGLSTDEELRFMMKDNAHYGDWDTDLLANVYSGLEDLDLLECGLPENLLDGLGEDEPSGIADLDEPAPQTFKINAPESCAADLLRALKNLLAHYPDAKLEY